MIETILGSVSAATIVGGLVAYGRMQQKVDNQNELFDLLRADIKRLDERVADLTDFLLREFHGEDPDQIRSAAAKLATPRRDR